MSQVHITVEYEEMASLLSKDRNEAFAALMKKVFRCLSFNGIRRASRSRQA
jgi:hypothetical protein